MVEMIHQNIFNTNIYIIIIICNYCDDNEHIISPNANQCIVELSIWIYIEDINIVFSNVTQDIGNINIMNGRILCYGKST